MAAEMGVSTDNNVTIILGEGDKGNAILIRRCLRQWGFVYPVMRFGDGDGVLDFLSTLKNSGLLFRRRYIVMMALSMPRLGGLDVLKVMKQDAELAKVSVMTMLFEKDEDNVRASLAAGCEAVLAKPLEKDAFARALANIGVIKMSYSLA
jgi:CheY-like chemotaxis protein